MKHESNSRPRTRVPGVELGLPVLLACTVLLSLATVGMAFDQAQILSGNVSPTPAYLGAPTSEWSIPSADLSNGFAVPFDAAGLYSIAPSGGALGVFEWTGSDLNQELSSGNRAHGTFVAGGLLKISGRLLNGANLLHDGLLFEGVVGAFEIWESETNQNRLELIGQPLVTPTANAGAYLNANGLLAGPYILSFQGVQAEQNGGDLTNLVEDINTIAALQFSLVSVVPEPATFLLVAGAAGLLVVRRKRG